MLNRLKVIHLVRAFGPDVIFGGGECAALELAKLMASRVPNRLVSFGAKNRGKVYGFGQEEIAPGVLWLVRGCAPIRTIRES